MYKLPVENEAAEQVIARRALGVYAAKFDLVGTAVDGEKWKHTLYEATLYRLDTKHIDGRYPDMYHGKFRQGMGCKDDPTTSRYTECLWLDMDAYANVSENNTLSELDTLQNYVNEFGYDSKDSGWLKHVIETVRSLENSYPELIRMFGEDFTARLDQVRDEIFAKTGERYEQDNIWELICVDPDEDELEEIEDGDYDYEGICKRYATA